VCLLYKEEKETVIFLFHHPKQQHHPLPAIIMALIKSTYVINTTGTKTVSTMISRRDGEMRPEIAIGKLNGDKVIFNRENWRELRNSFKEFSEFFNVKRNNWHIQLFSEHYLSYIYTRCKFGEMLICVSQIRRNSESANFPTTAYFSKTSWEKLISIAPMIEYQLNHLESLCKPIQEILPIVAKRIHQYGGVTRDAAFTIMAKPENIDFAPFLMSDIDLNLCNRIVYEILLFHQDTVWELIFRNEIPST